MKRPLFIPSLVLALVASGLLASCSKKTPNDAASLQELSKSARDGIQKNADLTSQDRAKNIAHSGLSQPGTPGERVSSSGDSQKDGLTASGRSGVQQSAGQVTPEKLNPKTDLSAQVAHSQNSPAAQKKEPQTELVSTPTCFKLEFTHPKASGHSTDEACSQHKNIIKIGHTQYNKKSVCVRVNNTPVKFEIHSKHADQLMVGPLAGPDAKISVSYCLQENLCKEDCVVPRDEFMDALSGGMSDDGKAIAWDDTQEASANAQKAKSLEKTMKRELASLQEEDGASEQAQSADGLALYQGWKVAVPNQPSCQAGFKKEVRAKKSEGTPVSSNQSVNTENRLEAAPQKAGALASNQNGGS